MADGTMWLLICVVFLAFMQIGFTCLESGYCRSKNNINVAIKNIADFVVGLLGFWLIGYLVAYGPSFGEMLSGDLNLTGRFNQMGSGTIHLLFQSMFCCTAVTLMSGAVAERMRFNAYLKMSLFTSLIIYPIGVRWIWNSEFGWLKKIGFIDFAGATVVHSVGGWCALSALLIIGPRMGRFADDRVQDIGGSNLGLSAIGVLFIWVGMLCFNGGSSGDFSANTAGIIVNTLMAGASGGAVFLFRFMHHNGVYDIQKLLNGILAGLVAVTAGCHLFSTFESILIGATGALFANFLSQSLIRFKIDDVVSVVPVHLGSGILGTLSVAFLGQDGSLHSDFLQRLGVQILGVVSVGLFAFCVSFLFLSLVNKWQPLRVTAKEEEDGLNISEHGASTVIHDMMVTMFRQKESGDVSLRAKGDRFTDEGKIAICYNEVLDKLENEQKKFIENSERLSSLGMLISEVAHDVRNPLHIINGSIFILEDSLAKATNIDENTAELIRSVRKESSRIADLMSLLLDYGRGSEMVDFSDVDLNDVIVQSLDLCRYKLQKSQIAVKKRIDCSQILVRAKAIELVRIVTNLLTNSIDGINESKVDDRWIEITVQETEDRWFLSVKDSGPPIPEEIQKKMFQAFYTTKSRDQGTGIGLSAATHVLERHNGYIELDTKCDHPRMVISLPKISNSINFVA